MYLVKEKQAHSYTPSHASTEWKDMKIGNEKILRCSACGGLLDLTTFESTGAVVLEGTLTCQTCSEWFRIENGIVDLLPLSIRRNDRHEQFASKHGLPVTTSTLQANAQKQGQLDFFKNFSNTYEEDITESPFFKALEEIDFHPWVNKNLHPGQNVLEIGAGSGQQTLPMALTGCNVFGLDLSEEMLQVARKKIAQHNLLELVTFVVADAEAAPVQANFFDALAFVGTLHHMDNPELALRNAAKALAPQGHFFSYDPHDSPLRPLFDWIMSTWALWDEEARDDPLFSIKQMRSYLEGAGIEPQITISIFLPPHVCLFFGHKFNLLLLRATDMIGNKVPFLKYLGGLIVCHGRKK